ncbi:MAG TPA: pirin family protein [Azospirillaceae bacterium]|nr:pirin family protein [Azospirillaceae bacterium]
MIELVIDQRRKDLGGFEVGRVLPVAARRMVGPFVFFDHMGPADMAPGIPRSVDVRPHPHIGLSTVTYLFEGEIMHRDSVGSEQPIRPGEVNWMLAGRGITHSERFERARLHGDRLHGIQAWVALPDHEEEAEPGFWHHGLAELPTFGEGGVAGRIVAGGAFGLASQVRTHSPMVYLHLELAPGARFKVPDEQPERAVYVAEGSVEIAGRTLRAGQMAVLAPGAVDLAAPERAVLMVLGGEPVGPRFIEWNFVSSSRERIEQAKADWRAGRMKLPDLDDAEFIPLPGTPPGDPPPAPNPMS